LAVRASEQQVAEGGPRRRGRWWLTPLYMLVVALAVLAALRWGRRDAGADMAFPLDGRFVAASRPAGDTDSVPHPESFADEPELIDLDRLPGDLAMPPGATVRSIVAYRALGDERIKAEYVAPGDVATVAESLADRLTELGWVAAGGAAARDDRTSLLFVKSGDTLSVHLNGEGVCVMIVAVIHRGEVLDQPER
jgi:hypothetical protein